MHAALPEIMPMVFAMFAQSLGFNIPYEFNDSDYEICHDLIIVFLDESVCTIHNLLYSTTTTTDCRTAHVPSHATSFRLQGKIARDSGPRSRVIKAVRSNLFVVSHFTVTRLCAAPCTCGSRRRTPGHRRRPRSMPCGTSSRRPITVAV